MSATQLKHVSLEATYDEYGNGILVVMCPQGTKKVYATRSRLIDFKCNCGRETIEINARQGADGHWSVMLRNSSWYPGGLEYL